MVENMWEREWEQDRNKNRIVNRNANGNGNRNTNRNGKMKSNIVALYSGGMVENQREQECNYERKRE